MNANHGTASTLYQSMTSGDIFMPEESKVYWAIVNCIFTSTPKQKKYAFGQHYPKLGLIRRHVPFPLFTSCLFSIFTIVRHMNNAPADRKAMKYHTGQWVNSHHLTYFESALTGVIRNSGRLSVQDICFVFIRASKIGIAGRERERVMFISGTKNALLLPGMKSIYRPLVLSRAISSRRIAIAVGLKEA